MSDEFNMSLRKFLKRLGVTGQQEIERAVRNAVASGRVGAGDALPVRATIRIDAVGLEHTIEGEIHGNPDS